MLDKSDGVAQCDLAVVNPTNNRVASKQQFLSINFVTRVARSIGVALLLAVPALAQSGSGLSPPDVKRRLEVAPAAPTPTDQHGAPSQPQRPAATEQEEASGTENRREVEPQVVDTRREGDQPHDADEVRAAEQLAEQQKFHGRIMTAVYVGLALMAVLVASRLFKRR